MEWKMNQILKRINEVQVTKAVANCLGCGLPELVCICSDLAALKSDNELSIKLHVLMHEKELSRNTNTAKLLDHVFGNQVHFYVWKRKEPPEELLHLIHSSEDSVYLLYPSDEISNNIEAKELVAIQKTGSKNIHLLVLDGTWQEVRKILNKSPYLQKLVRLKMHVNGPSIFTLRRNQKEGNLCTFL